MLSFRKATQADMMLYLEWANDEEVRKQSYQTGTISLEDHTEWFLKKLNDDDCLMLLFENEAKVPVGQVRFQKENEKVYVIGISIAKEFRGKGLAGTILLMASDYFFEIFPKNSIHAYIKSTNTESVRSFVRAGFVFANNVTIENCESALYIKDKKMQIADFTVGLRSKPFIIAEMSGNHNRSLDRAKEIIKAAADAGAHAVKLQTYTADTMTINHKGGLFDITDKNSLWYGRNLYELYEEAHTPWEWHKPLFDYAKELGIICFSTPFDETAVDFLEGLNTPCYKIASFENTDHPLLKKVAQTGKPVIMSTGIADIIDIRESVQVLRKNGSSEIVLLKCTSTYPATPENTNLITIPELQKIFPDCIIGLSDHTMGVGASIASVALGARVIEKHFTLRRADGGIDSAFSMEPAEMKLLVVESERAFLALGKVQLNVQEVEEKSKVFKRSVYIVKDIKAGKIFTKENIRTIRPGDGLAPKYYEEILGKKARADYKKGTPMKMDYFE